MKKFDETLANIQEQYTRKSIKIERSIRAPRNLKLSEEFVEAFKREYSRLANEYKENNRSSKQLVEELTKSIQFLIP